MDKTEFINNLTAKTNLSVEESEKVNQILEDTLLVGKKNKDKITTQFMNELEIGEDEADNLYNSVMDLLKDGLIDKLNPFK